MSLYLKYRPQSLEDFVGNMPTVSALRSVLKKPRIEFPHALLFVGDSGCGKTTLARIVAKEIGCSDFDLDELDIADFRGIDTIRQIRRQMGLRPLKGEVKVYILDECHSLTKDAQGALLKALEDTPKHVYFMLCTTDPQKLLKTIHSRCMEFKVSPLSSSKMKTLIESVVAREAKSLPNEVIEYIALNSLGRPRQALVLLDKVVNVSPKHMMKMVERTAQEESRVVELCRALLEKKSWSKIAVILKGLQDQEPESVRRAVLEYFATVLLGGQDVYDIVDCFRDNFYDSGRAGLILACYEAVHSE